MQASIAECGNCGSRGKIHGLGNEHIIGFSESM
jgi:hypothetical protein